MPFSPDEFKAKSPIDFALPSTFLMRIPTTVLGAEVDYSELENLSFLCSQSVLPGRHFSTGEYTTHGPVRRTPYQSIYDQLQVNMYCRSDLLERKFFDHWQNAIQSDDTYKWRYFREYVTDLELWYFTRSIPAETTRGQHSQRNSEGNPSAQGPHNYDDEGISNPNSTLTDEEAVTMISHKVKFIDAFPLFVAPLPLDWASKDTFINLGVTFSYTKWQKMDTPRYEPSGTSRELLQRGGPTLPEMLGWASDTIDLIDQYTGAVPSWLKQGQQISGIGGSIAGAGSSVISRLPIFK